MRAPSQSEIQDRTKSLKTKLANAKEIITSSGVTQQDFNCIRRLGIHDKISASVIASQNGRFSEGLVTACLFRIPSVTAHSLFLSSVGSHDGGLQGLSFGSRSRKVADLWEKMSENDRAKFIGAAEQLKQAYAEIEHDWQDFCERKLSSRQSDASTHASNDSDQRLRHVSDDTLDKRARTVQDQNIARRINKPAPEARSALANPVNAARASWYARHWHLLAPFLPPHQRSIDSLLARNLGVTTAASASGASADTTTKVSAACAAASVALCGDTHDISTDELDQDLPQRVGQPRSVVGGVMLEYQLEGLQWLLRQHKDGVGGILGDEMGLGKTLQVISLLAQLKERGEGGPHIIMSPLSVLGTWQSELARWCPSLRAVCFYGGEDARATQWREHLGGRAPEFDIIITTYDMVVAEVHRLSHWNYSYVILDEAQRIKNEQTQIGVAVRRLRGQHKLLLTGTPLQNDLHELWALLNFLMPEVFQSSEVFDAAFARQISGGARPVVDLPLVASAHRLLGPLMLRRLKGDVQKELPPKTVLTIWCPLTRMQKFWYKSLLEHTVSSISKVENVAKWKKLMNLVMQLRKIVNHPYMFVEADPDPEVTDEGVIHNSSKMMVLHKLLARLKQDGHRVLVYSQFTTMLDILEDYCSFVGHSYFRLDGGTSFARRKYEIDLFNNGSSGHRFVYLLSTRAGALGITLTGADTVVMYDSDWNPTWDRQAHDRVHRIGQTRPVTVYQLLCHQTVEERIFQRAQMKLSLNELVLRDHTEAPERDEDVRALTGHEIRSLLQCGARKLLTSQDGEAELTDEEVEELIRSASADSIRRTLDAGGEEGAEDDVFSQALWDVRRFEQRRFETVGEACRTIADAWAQQLEREPKKRESVATTVLVSGFAVKKANRSMEAASAPVAKKIKPVTKDVLCLYCSEQPGTDHLLVSCSVANCHRTFHKDCHAAFHTQSFSLGLRCHQHSCGECGASSSNSGGLLFRCSGCPSTFCVGCLPLSVRAHVHSSMLDRADVLNAVGFISTSYEYIRCPACLQGPPSALHLLLLGSPQPSISHGEDEAGAAPPPSPPAVASAAEPLSKRKLPEPSSHAAGRRREKQRKVDRTQPQLGQSERGGGLKKEGGCCDGDEVGGSNEEEEKYEVQRIIKMRARSGQMELLVRYGPSADSWEPLENLLACEEAICQFEECHFTLVPRRPLDESPPPTLIPPSGWIVVLEPKADGAAAADLAGKRVLHRWAGKSWCSARVVGCNSRTPYTHTLEFDDPEACGSVRAPGARRGGRGGGIVPAQLDPAWYGAVWVLLAPAPPAAAALVESSVLVHDAAACAIAEGGGRPLTATDASRQAVAGSSSAAMPLLHHTGSLQLTLSGGVGGDADGLLRPHPAGDAVHECKSGDRGLLVPLGGLVNAGGGEGGGSGKNDCRGSCVKSGDGGDVKSGGGGEVGGGGCDGSMVSAVKLEMTD